MFSGSFPRSISILSTLPTLSASTSTTSTTTSTSSLTTSSESPVPSVQESLVTPVATAVPQQQASSARSETARKGVKAGIAIGAMTDIVVCGLLLFWCVRRRRRNALPSPHVEYAMPQELDAGLDQPSLGELAGEKSPRELDTVNNENQDVNSIPKLDDAELPYATRYSEVYPTVKKAKSAPADNAAGRIPAIKDGEIQLEQPQELEATSIPQGEGSVQIRARDMSDRPGSDQVLIM